MSILDNIPFNDDNYKSVIKIKNLYVKLLYSNF